MKSLFIALLLGTAGLAYADPPSPDAQREIPTTEKEFVDGVSGADKTKVLEQFGEPSKMNDVKTNTGRIVASIWHYHYLNTDQTGAYYQTTELDFVDDKVVMVVFLNNNGEDGPTPDAEQNPSEETPVMNSPVSTESHI